jgi:hypothetical protein
MRSGSTTLRPIVNKDGLGPLGKAKSTSKAQLSTSKNAPLKTKEEEQ